MERRCSIGGGAKMFLCDDTITVFNPVLDEETGIDIWKGTVVNGVSWYCNMESSVDSTGLKAANKFMIRIPDSSGIAANFVEPKQYTGDGFTLTTGTVIVHGAAETSGMTPAKLKEKYAEVVTILGVTDNRRAPYAKHWKVTGA